MDVGTRAFKARAKNTFPGNVGEPAHYGAMPKPNQLALKLVRLLTQAEFMNDGFIALGIVFLQIIQQATTLADQHKKAAARAVVFLVGLEVLRQGTNTLAQQRNLHFGTAGIGGVRAILVNEGLLLLSG
jgi:hypothetical protein